MKLTVRVVGHAVEYFPGGKGLFELEFDGPVRVRDILSRLEVGRTLVMAAIIDGKRREFDFEVPAGAEVILMTPPAGG